MRRRERERGTENGRFFGDVCARAPKRHSERHDRVYDG
jgi:hypothetical protein